MEFERCRDILVKEGELVGRIGGLQDVVYAAVAERDWSGFESKLGELDGLGRELEGLEREREGLFAEAPGDADGRKDFYATVSGFPEDRRREITDAYRSLKVMTVRVKSAGETLMGYISAQRATMAGFFDAAFPDRAAKTYSPYGKQVSDDMSSMVLSRHY